MDNLVIECEELIKDKFKEYDDICFENSKKVLEAFRRNSVSFTHFNSTNGYGYDDIGRDTIERVYADIFKCEDALVRNQFISGSHALNVAFFACLRPNDLMLSISGLPYDTLHEVIGIKDNPSSLASFGVKYDQIDLVDDDFDYDQIEKYLQKNKVKLIEIQRSKGYSTRKSITIDKVEKVISLIKRVSPDTIIMVDNCYCEFVSTKEPTEVGADIVVGSLIKNLGGGIAQNGAYIVGRKDLIELAGERLTLPGEGKEVGPSLNSNREVLMGLFHAPEVVKNSLKVATFTSAILEKLNYNVEPKWSDIRADIVQNIIFKNEELLIKYCQGIQAYSPIDSQAKAYPSDMPGYDDKVIMAAGAFTQGSSIELSCDGPLRPPYIAYQQGGLTYEYGKIAVINAINNLENENE